MAEKLTLSFTTPYAELAEREVDEVVLPAILGEMGILPGHDSTMSLLDIGIVTVRDGQTEERYFVADGYFEVVDDKLLLLAEVAEPTGDIDAQRAADSLKRAKERLEHALDKDVDGKRAEKALKRALFRLAGGKKS